MEAVQKRSTQDGLKRYLSTRRGAVTAAICAAILAGVVLVAFLQQYKHNIKNGTEPVSVLVAQRLIPAGTAGDVVASGGFFRPGSIARDDVKPGAIVDSALLSGRVATHDIYPGQQITLADFLPGADSLRSKLQGTQRAIALALDSQHGMTGTVRAGDHVDILYSTGANNSSGAVTRTLMQNVLVLAAPGVVGSTALGAGSAAPSGNVIMEVSDRDAAKLAFAQQNGSLWFTLRPPVGAKQDPPSTVTLQSVSGGH
jgi:Flp pilus assembly protein CpaB